MSKLRRVLPGLCLAVILVLSPAVASVGGGASAPEAPLALRQTDPALRWGPCPPLFPAACRIAVLHGDPARPNADIFLRVDGSTDLPPHSHRSAERMILVSGELEVGYKGVPPTVLTPGSYAYGPAGMPHRAHCRSAGPCILFIAFEGPVDATAHAGGLD